MPSLNQFVTGKGRETCMEFPTPEEDVHFYTGTSSSIFEALLSDAESKPI